MRKGQSMPEEAKKKVSEKLKQLHKEGRISKAGCYKKGHEPWNFGISMHLSPRTEFKPGQLVGEKHHSWRGGVNISADDGTYLWISKGKRARRARVVYEKAHGKIPKGYVIFHINGDRDDDSIENLEAITRAELLQRNI